MRSVSNWPHEKSRRFWHSYIVIVSDSKERGNRVPCKLASVTSFPRNDASPDGSLPGLHKRPHGLHGEKYAGWEEIADDAEEQVGEGLAAAE